MDLFSPFHSVVLVKAAVIFLFIFFEVVYSLFWGSSSVTSYFSFVFLRSSFHPPGTVFFVTSFRSWVPFFFILSPIIILFLSVIVSMSSSPDSMYSASLGVDSGTISILLMMQSSSWSSFLFSFFVGFPVSPAYVIMGIMQADTTTTTQ